MVEDKEKKGYFLVGDVGGTHTTLGVASFSDLKYEIIFKKRYFTSDFESLKNIIKLFYLDFKCENFFNIKVLKGVCGVARTTFSNDLDAKFKLGNNPLIIDKKNILELDFIEDIYFINDFESIAWSTLSLKKNQIEFFKNTNNLPYKIDSSSILTVLGAGTGLGKSKLKNLCSYSSQDGHIEFIFNEDSKFEQSLKNFLLKIKTNNIIEFEDLVSGKGIENIYEYLSGKKLLAEKIFSMKKTDFFAKETFYYFFKFFARFSRIMVLKDKSNFLYLAGGIIIKNLNFSHDDFYLEFINSKNKNEISFLKSVKIIIIKDYDISLSGVCEYILNKY